MADTYGKAQERLVLDSPQFVELTQDIRDYVLALEELWDEVMMFSGRWHMAPGDAGSLMCRTEKCAEMRRKLLKEE